MARPKEIRGRRMIKNIVFEGQRLEEFEELCRKERKSLSEYLRELIVRELEKKVTGGNNRAHDCNPLNIKYHDETIKSSQLTFDEFPTHRWFTREDAVLRVKDYIEKYNIRLPNAFAYHNNMQQVIAFRMKGQEQRLKQPLT
jgi:hypothetical protein